MTEEVFDRNAHHLEKYGEPPHYWSRETFEKRHRLVVKAICAAVGETEREFQETFSCSSGLCGVLIHGSWAASTEGSQVWVHDRSDIDMYVISHGVIMGIIDRFEASLGKKLKGHVSVDIIGAIDYTDPKELDKSKAKNNLFQPNEHVVVILPPATSSQHEEIRTFLAQTDLHVLFETP